MEEFSLRARYLQFINKIKQNKTLTKIFPTKYFYDKIIYFIKTII